MGAKQNRLAQASVAANDHPHDCAAHDAGVMELLFHLQMGGSSASARPKDYSVSQNHAHPVRQGIQEKGLLQNGNVLFIGRHFQHRWLGVPRHEEHFHIGVQLFYPRGHTRPLIFGMMTSVNSK